MAFTYQFLDDIALADIAFDVRGDSLQEVFTGATQVLIEILANPATVASTWERAIAHRR